jgi:hypothetical protein
MSQTPPHSVLLAVILSENAEVSMNFTEMIVTLQRQLAYTPSAPVQIEFVNSVNAALTLFERMTQHSRLLIIDGDVGCDVSFIQKDHPIPIVVASYATRAIDWERISSYIMRQRESGNVPSPEEAKAEGCIYNFEPAARACISGTYLPIKKAQAKVVSLHRTAIDTFRSIYDAATKTVEPRATDPAVVVDLSTTVKNPGPYDFAGVVGRRLLQARETQNKTQKETQVPEAPAPVIDSATDASSIQYM